MHADIVRLAGQAVGIKVIPGDQMHVLQWRRSLLWDEVLRDGTRQAPSAALSGRERVYGRVFRCGESDQGKRSSCCPTPGATPATGAAPASGFGGSGSKPGTVRSWPLARLIRNPPISRPPLPMR